MASSALSDYEVWAVIKLLIEEDVTGSKIHHRLNNVYGVGIVIFFCHLFKWIERFNTGWSDTHDDQRTDHPQDSISDETIACVHTLLVEDCWFTISDIP